MAWRDDLRKASYRGVEFHVDAATLTAGRRLARHEYPQRDTPYLEDMGRKGREYKVEAFVIGADYMSQRDKLLAAIETAGAGQLVHPYYGTLQVAVSGECQITESTQQGGMARISIPFLEAGIQQEPLQSVDSTALLASQRLVCDEAFAADFIADFSVDGQPDFVAEDALGGVANVLAAPGVSLKNEDWIASDPESALNALLPHNLQTSLTRPASLANGLLELVRNAKAPQGLLDLSFGAAPLGGGSAARVTLAKNRSALGALVLQAATVRRVMDLSAAPLVTQDDARAARTEVVSRVDAVLFSDATGQDSSAALAKLRTLAVSHFAAITPNLPRLASFIPQSVRTSLVIAHDLYGDDWLSQNRADELVARNNIRRPGFVTAGEPLSWVTT